MDGVLALTLNKKGCYLNNKLIRTIWKRCLPVTKYTFDFKWKTLKEMNIYKVYVVEKSNLKTDQFYKKKTGENPGDMVVTAYVI